MQKKFFKESLEQSMTMPMPEPSPQMLTERSASFSCAELRQSTRVRASHTDTAYNGDVEFMENLTCVKSVVHHVRKSSLDSHPSALHPINLNSKFDHLCSPLSPAKAAAKVYITMDNQADKESSFFSAPHTQREGGGEPQEELSIGPHESLLQDAQEELLSTSLSAESKSPREHLDFILWGNAAFCLSEARDLMNSSTKSGLRRQSQRLSEASIKNHLQNGMQCGHTNPPVEGLLSARDEGSLPSKDTFHSREKLLSPESVEPSPHLVASAISAMESSIEETEDSVKRQSSVGSTLSIHNSSTMMHTHPHHLQMSAKEKPLMSSEAQSCCLDFDGHEMEGSGALDCETQANQRQDMENASKEMSEEGKNPQGIDKYTQEAAQMGCLSSSHLHTEAHQEGGLIAAEEVKIRAELELEIEKDLEQEIKTKIYLLNRRLEELAVLKATRHLKHEQSDTHMEEGSSPSIIGQEDHVQTITNGAISAPLPKSPPSSRSSKNNKSTLEHSKAEKVSGHAILASSKKQVVTGGNEKETHSSHANTPLTSWRKFATASGWAPHTKDGSTQLSSSDGSLKNIKISKHSIDGPSAALKPKVQIESTSSFKPDYQSWTGVASSKKFDWIRTLRSDVPSTPRISSMKNDGEESSAFLPSSKETVYGNVARTLFAEDSLYTPRKTVSKAPRREGSLTPLVGSSKKTMFSSTKTHNVPAQMVVSTPRIRSAMPSLLKDTQAAKSASAKCLSQKPPSGIQSSRDPMRRTPEPRQDKIPIPTSKQASMSRASPQQTSSKVSRIEKKTTVGAPASSNRISLMKNGSPMPAEKLKNGLPNSSAHGIGSKEIKNAPAKTPSKQASPASKSRVAPSTMPANCTPQTTKMARVVPLSNLAKRQSSTPLKSTGASTTREKVASRH